MEALLKNTFVNISPVWELVQDTTVGTATTNVDFSSLNFGKEDELMLVSDYKQPESHALSILFNENYTVTNYWIQRIQADGTSPTAARGNSATLTGIAGTNNLTIARIKLTNNGYIVWQAGSLNKYTTTSPTIYDSYGTSTFTETSITSIRFNAVETNNIAVGSRFQLYKLVAEKVADITISTATTNVDISGLSIDKESEYMLVSEIVNSAGSASDYNLFANANYTATNYYSQSVLADSTTVSGARTNNTRFCFNSSAQRSIAYIPIKLTNNGYFVAKSDVARHFGGSGMRLEKRYLTSTFTATSLTAFRISASVTNAIGIGSRFQLYKMK